MGVPPDVAGCEPREGMERGFIKEGFGGACRFCGMASGCAAVLREREFERKEGAACCCDDLAFMISRSSKSSSTSEMTPSLGSESLTSSIRACDMIAVVLGYVNTDVNMFLISKLWWGLAAG